MTMENGHHKVTNNHSSTPTTTSKVRYDYVKLRTMPSFSKLNEKVQNMVKASSWWDLYGVDWMKMLALLAAAPFGLLLLRQDSTLGILGQVAGIFILGCGHSAWANKGGHLASHSALAKSDQWNSFWMTFFIDFCGSFSKKAAQQEHVQIHHPHTNIIGLGDSSTWKAPFVPRYLYMFVTPLLVPVLTPAVALWHLRGQWVETVKFLAAASAGVALEVFLLMAVTELTVPRALGCLCMIRAVMGIPYIHVNIFQHIGLPMYSQQNRPVRIYQMSTGVLNLDRDPVLDVVFGHGLVNCHVEHHLFPKLSDNMCLKIKPLVKTYLLENGLPYKEEPYGSMLKTFTDRYNDLMVDAPPVTHFVGLQ